MTFDIRKSTMNVCAGWQRASSESAASARRYRERGDLEMAIFCQTDAAHQHREVAIRLDQLV